MLYMLYMSNYLQIMAYFCIFILGIKASSGWSVDKLQLHRLSIGCRHYTNGKEMFWRDLL